MKQIDHKGFTLVEVLVSMAVFMILVTAFVVNFRSLRRSEDVRFAASELVIHLREAQSSAFNGKEVGGVIPSSFGLYFNEECPDSLCTYIMFADINDNDFYDPGDDLVLNTYTLPQEVVFLGYSIGAARQEAPHSFVFRATGAQFVGDGILGEEVHLFLKHSGTNICEDVYVKGSVGQIGSTSYSSVSDNCK